MLCPASGDDLGRAFALAREPFPDRVHGWAPSALAGAVAFCVHNVVDTTFESGAAAYSIWVLGGIVMGLHVRYRPVVAGRSPARGMRGMSRGRVKGGSVAAA